MFDPKTKFLVVDDMLTMRKIVAKALSDLGYKNTVQAADGVEAMKILREPANQIDFVVSDWNMPNKTGLEMLKEVRADEKLKGIPFVLLTAESEAAQVVEALKAGVDEYVIKPFSADILKGKLANVHKKRNKAA